MPSTGGFSSKHESDYEKTELSFHSYAKDDNKEAFDFIGEKCKLDLNIDASHQSISKKRVIYENYMLIHNMNTKMPVSPEMNLRRRGIGKRRFALNVGGIRHEVMWTMLEQYPGSRLGALAKAETCSQILTLASDYSPATNELFFDRHPRSFNTILNFYRTGKLHVCDEMCSLAFKDDLEYWGLSEDLLETCCKTNFDKKVTFVMEEMEGECKKMQKEAEEEFSKGFIGRNQKCLWDIIEHPETSGAAQFVSYMSMFFVIVSTIGMSLNTMPAFRVINSDQEPAENPFLALNEAICIAWFTLEYFLRLVGCPKKMEFLQDKMNLVDVLAIMPYYMELVMRVENKEVSGVGLGGEDMEEEESGFRGLLQVFRVFKLARILKMARHSTGLQSIVFTLQQSSRELGLLILFIGMAGLVFSCLCYYIEQDEDSGYTDIPTSFYWVVITMTTVGYGDIYPVTGLGKLVGTLCAISGALVMSLPIPIIVSNFERHYSEQQRTTRLKARRARVADAKRVEEHARLAIFGISPNSPEKRRASSKYSQY